MLLVCAGQFSSPAQEPVRPLQGASTSFAPFVEKVAPTVVTVFTTQNVSKTVLPFPLSDETLREFYGGQLPQGQGKQTLEGLGSGVIVSADGYILTADHVVAKASEIMVGLGAELRKYKAKKVGADPGTDIALLKIEEKNRGYIGTSVQTLTPELADAMKLKAQVSGALVGEVSPKSPAEKAGIKTGDVITSVNGKKISDARELRLMIGSMSPGTKVQIEVNREGQKKTLDVDLVEMPAAAIQPATEASPEESAQPEKSTVFGAVVVADVTDDVRTALNLPKEIQGAVIVELDSASPAAQSGLRDGDVIQEVNKQPVKNAKDLVALSKKLKPNEKILMRVYSEGRSSYVALEPK